MITIGVLGVQGAIKEHIDKLSKISNVTPIIVKTKEEIELVEGLVLPGGESTAIGKILDEFKLMAYLKEKIQNGLPVWGTCAGMILLAKKLSNDKKAHLQVMDIEVKRNAYGAQIESFITNKVIEEISENPIPLVFIRAPYVERVYENVRVLAEVDGNIVACRQGNMLATSFHPEITEDLSFHKYFVNIIEEYKVNNIR